jgi:uncharacterized membrane protein
MNSLIEPNLHPILVHFAYALSITAVISYLLSRFPPTAKWRDSLSPAADWMLAFGAIAIVLTIAAGFQAYYTVDHDTPSHAAMTTHRNWAVPSGTAILLLSILRWTSRAKAASALFVGGLAAAALALSVTAWWGGKIVYGYGLGVKSMPVVTGDGHDHDHGNASSNPKAAGHDMSVMASPDAAPAAHDDGNGHPDSEPEPNVPDGHDNSDGHHDPAPAGHDNADGHHDAPVTRTEDAAILQIIDEIEAGWEDGSAAPFRMHFLDFEGARYFESGGGNTGLEDLIINHVEPEKTSIPDLELNVSNIDIHYEGDFAWAVGDTTVQGTIARTDETLDRTGKQTWLFRKVDGAWRVVHTHSSSRAKR